MDAWKRQDKRSEVKRSEEAGEVADSLEVRKALLRRVDSGEITLAESQKEHRKIKRNAKKAGKVTRNQAWHRG